jgi:hypothetical protein
MPVLSLMKMSLRDRRATVRGDREGSELESELRQAAARFDPVPPELLAAAAGAFSWRTIEAELAELVFDSQVDHDEVALVRGPPERRLLSFHAAGLTIDLEVTAVSSSRGLVGQLAPPRQASVEIRVGDTSIAVEADDLGRFRAGPLPTGPMSLRCGLASGVSGRPVVTDWVPI